MCLYIECNNWSENGLKLKEILTACMCKRNTQRIRVSMGISIEYDNFAMLAVIHERKIFAYYLFCIEFTVHVHESILGMRAAFFIIIMATCYNIST